MAGSLCFKQIISHSCISTKQKWPMRKLCIGCEWGFVGVTPLSASLKHCVGVSLTCSSFGNLTVHGAPINQSRAFCKQNSVVKNGKSSKTRTHPFAVLSLFIVFFLKSVPTAEQNPSFKNPLLISNGFCDNKSINVICLSVCLLTTDH